VLSSRASLAGFGVPEIARRDAIDRVRTMAGCNNVSVLPDPPPSSSSHRAGKVPSIKGLVFKEFVKWYEDSRGREASLQAYRSLPAELRAHLDPERDTFGILASSWYPVHIVSGLLESITLGLAPEERSALLRDGVHHAIGVTLTGVYKVLFQTLVTPERHAKYAQKIWNQYYNTGTVVGALLDPNRATQVITDWSGHHPLLCELSISSLTVFHEHMGCRNVRVRRTSCVLDARLSARHARRSSSTKLKAVRPAEVVVELHVEACRFLIQWDPR
jgi:hypothetical protein